MKQNGNILVVILTVGLLISISIGGYFFYQNQQLQKQNLTKTETTTPSVAKDKTANWRTHTVKTISLEFKLPPSFDKYGDFSETSYPGQKGSELCATFPSQSTFNFIKPVSAGGNFCYISIFGLATTSLDYMAGRGGSFSDLQGYTFENNKYFAKLNQNVDKKFEIPSNLAKELTSDYGIKILRVIGKNSTSGEWQGPISGTPGDGSIGAILNTTNKTYPGITIVMNLKDGLDENTFDQILSTFKFTNSVSSKFDYSTIKVGDKVGNMTASSISPYESSRPISSTNYRVLFKGSTTVTGKYFQLGQNGMISGRIGVCFNELDQTSLSLLPQKTEEYGRPWFCFANASLADKEFLTGSGVATIVIDDYSVVAFPSEVWNTATLVKVINK